MSKLQGLQGFSLPVIALPGGILPEEHSSRQHRQDNGTPHPHQNTLQAISPAPMVKNPYGWHTQPPPQAPAGHIACAHVLRHLHRRLAIPAPTSCNTYTDILGNTNNIMKEERAHHLTKKRPLGRRPNGLLMTCSRQNTNQQKTKKAQLFS